MSTTTNFKASALSTETLQLAAPSIFAQRAASGLSPRYTFVPTAEIVQGLREANWAPVHVEEQRPRKVERLGFQKHLLRFRQVEQMQTLDEWNVELVLLNSRRGLRLPTPRGHLPPDLFQRTGGFRGGLRGVAVPALRPRPRRGRPGQPAGD